MVNIIVAMDDNRLIGNGNELPWHIPDDLRLFRNHTIGKVVIMGRKTFESIGRPDGLPNRTNVVISRIQHNQETPVIWMDSLTAAIEKYSDQEIFIIGGATIYQQALALADNLYISQVHGSFEGDVYFPPISWDDWTLVRGDKYQDFTFELYRRKVNG